MKCPFCSKEIKDDAVFCGFCGKPIPQKPLEEAPPMATPVNSIEAKEFDSAAGKSESVKYEPSTIQEDDNLSKERSKPKKKRTALKILLAFVILSLIVGGALGFLTARGYISLSAIMPNSDFTWTSFLEGHSETTDTDNSGDNDEKNNTESMPTDKVQNDEDTSSEIAENN